MKRLMLTLLISLVLLPAVSADASDLGDIRFSFIRGDVQVRTEDTDDWVPASINMPLREGDRIWVPEEGMAELQAKDGSHLRLADGSALEILALDRESYQAYLTEGRLYANFRGRKDSLLQIDTPTSSVRAHERSRFNVDVPERGPVAVSVFHGEVGVENRDGSIRVASGEVLSLGEGTDSEKSALRAPDDWERWNRDRDGAVAERQPPSRHLPEELQPYSNDFHDNGRWVHTADYGYVWTPTVSVSVGWAPYRSGRWVWIGGDYVWVSYEPWGWVPYHYGRWSFVVSIGWCWVPPSRGAVYWGPGYVGWVHNFRHVAWVPLGPGEIYYGRGHHGPHSVNITHVNVTRVDVDKVVYKNVRIPEAVTTVSHETFARGKPADARVRENPFLKEKIHVGRPPIQPEKSSTMPVVREVPQTKRPPEPIQRVNVKELKAQRPLVKGKDASVFAPETRPREMPVKASEAKPLQTPERAGQARRPSSGEVESRPSAAAENHAGRPAPAKSTVQTSKVPTNSGEPVGGTKLEKKAPAEVQAERQPAPADKARMKSAPAEPAVKTSNETRTPERGRDGIKESRESDRRVEPARSPDEKAEGKRTNVKQPERAVQQAPEPRTPEKRMQKPRQAKNGEREADRR